jgi:hypothetical protein
MVNFQDEERPITRAEASLGFNSTREAVSVNEQQQTNEDNAVE